MQEAQFNALRWEAREEEREQRMHDCKMETEPFRTMVLQGATDLPERPAMPSTQRFEEARKRNREPPESRYPLRRADAILQQEKTWISDFVESTLQDTQQARDAVMERQQKKNLANTQDERAVALAQLEASKRHLQEHPPPSAINLSIRQKKVAEDETLLARLDMGLEGPGVRMQRDMTRHAKRAKRQTAALTKKVDDLVADVFEWDRVTDDLLRGEIRFEGFHDKRREATRVVNRVEVVDAPWREQGRKCHEYFSDNLLVARQYGDGLLEAYQGEDDLLFRVWPDGHLASYADWVTVCVYSAGVTAAIKHDKVVELVDAQGRVFGRDGRPRMLPSGEQLCVELMKT